MEGLDLDLYLSGPCGFPPGQVIKMLQQHERTGRPLGSDGFLTHIEKSIDRLLRPKRPGRKSMKGKK